jgi:alpha-tubulin suppressor-like RCC1 family protein
MLVAGATPASAAPEADQIPLAWGNGPNGQLGNGALTSNQTTPLSTVTSGVLAGKVVTAISAGAAHTCALTSDGAAYCWGYQGNGRLGDGVVATTNQTTPALVTGFTDGVTQISAGQAHTCAVKSGVAYCWGSQSNGRVGNGTSTGSVGTPSAVLTSGALSGKTVTGISAGSSQSCAVTSDGGAYCWGNGSSGRLGDGNTAAHDVLTPTGPLAGTLTGQSAVEISTGSGSSCARTAAGLAQCWGSNASGELGSNGTIGVSQGLPVAVTTSGVLAGKSVTHISVGLNHACAVASGGAFCWGSGARGRLGNGGTSLSAVPAAVITGGVLSGKTVSRIAAGGLHSCAVTADGVGACWGAADNGRLGNGSTAPDQLAPDAVSAVALGNGKVRPVLAISASSAGGASTPTGLGAFSAAVYGWTTSPGTVTGVNLAGPVLGWTPPTYSGIPAFTSYQVLYRVNAGASPTPAYGTFCQNLSTAGTTLNLATYASSGAPAGATCNRSKGVLVTGTAYQFLVVARNTTGTGRVSANVVYTP